MFSTFLLYYALSSPFAIHSEKIEARVGGEIITSTDIDMEMQRIQRSTMDKKSKKNLRELAFNTLVEQELVEDHLASLQIKITDQDIDRRIQAILQSQGISSIEDFRQMLSQQGITLSSFRDRIKRQMLMGQFNQILERQSLQTLSENELRAYYKNHREDFASNPELQLQECMIPEGDDPKKAQKIAKKYQNNPKAFDTCVRLHSKAPSAKNSGDLGFIGKNLLRPEVEQIVFSTDVGEVARVDAPGAIQLLKIKSKKEKGPISFEQAKTEIRAQIKKQRLQKARAELIRDLRTRTYIQIDS